MCDQLRWLTNLFVMVGWTSSVPWRPCNDMTLYRVAKKQTKSSQPAAAWKQTPLLLCSLWWYVWSSAKLRAHAFAPVNSHFDRYTIYAYEINKNLLLKYGLARYDEIQTHLYLNDWPSIQCTAWLFLAFDPRWWKYGQTTEYRY